MREWSLKEGNPLTLTLATDARLLIPDYTNDHIWEVKLREGEPPALAVQTTYGLRASIMRMFPRFKEGETTVMDPSSFTRPPAVHRFYPNYILLTYSPFPGIDVVNELWVPENQALTGRFRVINNGVTQRSLRLEWTALLTPDETGERINPAKIQGVTVLKGLSGGLAPVVFITGGPQPLSSPYPALGLEMHLLPGLERQYTWVQAALSTTDESFDKARGLASRNWEAESARLELVNAATVDIKTGDPDWDAAFALGQKVGLGLMHGPSEHLPDRSLVQTRLPDQGYSLGGDGSEYNYLWNGQTSLDAWYLAGLLLPAAPEFVMGLLRNFLAIQAENGYVDWKPGLAGQRSRLDATPLLAQLAWDIFQYTEDLTFLGEIFPDLLTFYLGWFSPYHDRDGDGVPEWDRLLQTGFEDLSLFSSWLPASQGVDIDTCESPSLSSLLYKEGQILLAIAASLEIAETVQPLENVLVNLKDAVESTWDDNRSTYRYRDRDSHQTGPSELLLKGRGSGTKPFTKVNHPPVRPVITVETHDQGHRRAALEIHGTGLDQKAIIAEIQPEQFRWQTGLGVATSPLVFHSLDHIRILGLDSKDKIVVRSVDYTPEDLTLLLPLYAGIPDADRSRVLIRQTVADPRRYWRPFGLPANPWITNEGEETTRSAVLMPWNAMIGAGLLAAGYRGLAADLLARLMRAIVGTLKNDRAFRGRYDAETGLGHGERDALQGLPPMKLFLDILGVRLISPWKVGLEGLNPFPWPVEVKYRGLTIQRDKKETLITFPDGQSLSISDPKPCVVEKSSSHRQSSA
jgi:hypothetical protein